MGGALKAGLQCSREEDGGTWELYHSNLLAKPTFFSKLQTAALTMIMGKVQVVNYST